MVVGDPLGRLVLSIDIGTTQSAVAIYYEHPRTTDDESTKVDNVSFWPGQEEAIHLERVPTAVLYDKYDQLIACGAEATSHPDAVHRTKYFKMELHQDKRDYTVLSPSLNAISIMRIYTDFLEYLLQHARRYMKNMYGHDPWSFMRDRVEVILTHPNGWGEEQQKFLQTAAVNAGLISYERAQSSQGLLFIEEAEAATSYAVAIHGVLHGEPNVKLKKGFKFVVCDAGGSTTDVSAYVVRSCGKNVDGRMEIALEELRPPSSLQAGGVLVDQWLKNHLTTQLGHDSFIGLDMEGGQDALVEQGVKDFQSFGKRDFKSSSDSCEVNLGLRALTHDELGISRGKMVIKGVEAEKFFSSSTDPVIADIKSLVKAHDVQTIILTGGFSNSPYLLRVVKKAFESPTRSVLLINPKDSKAVAMGALRLFVGPPGSIKVIVDRKPRARNMWLTNLKQGVKKMIGHGKRLQR